MPTRSIPAKDKLTICFAHVAYQMAARFKLRNTGIEAFEVRSLDELERRIGEADVLLVPHHGSKTSSSPLLLDRVDEVVFVAADRVVAVGKHRDLLETEPRYRLTVTRQTEEEVLA